MAHRSAHRTKKIRALLMLVPLAAATLVGAMTNGAAAGPAAPVPVLSWGDCPQDPEVQVDFTGFQCADAKVPLDYDDPTGPTIDVEVIRHLATDPAHRIGSLFFNPGGPGGSGVLNLTVYYSHFPAALRADFDIVSFDPRGIEHSTPVTCGFATGPAERDFLNQAPTGFPVGAAQRTAWIDTYRTFGQDCAQNTGPVLDHMSTANVARDMDLLRQAVGDAKLNYIAPSYGTYLGATYANLFPDKIRAMDLESNVDPVAWNDAATGSALGTFLRQGADLGSASTLRYFLRQCGLVDTDRCAFSAGSPAATADKLRTLLRRLKAQPQVIGADTFTFAFTVATIDSGLYTTPPVDVPGVGPIGGYVGLAALLQQLYELSGNTGSPADRAASTRVSDRAGVTSPLLEGGRPSGTGGIYGVLCTDSPNPKWPGSYAAQSAFARRRSGVMGRLWAWAAEPCATWPVGLDPDRYVGPWNKPTSAPILLVGIRHDPATPYQASVKLSHDLADARLLTVSGSGHDVFFNPSTCVDDYATAYFLTGQLPPAGTVCAEDNPPF